MKLPPPPHFQMGAVGGGGFNFVSSVVSSVVEDCKKGGRKDFRVS